MDIPLTYSAMSVEMLLAGLAGAVLGTLAYYTFMEKDDKS